jgi:BMFP domain-containing protein YqiC
MAKKDKKPKKGGKSGATDPVEAVRSAVERTFQVTSEGAAGTRERTQQLVDEVAGAAARIRQTIEDLRVLEDVRGLRQEIASLASRVAALEGRLAEAWPPSRPAPAKSASRPAKPAKTSSAKSKAKSKSPAQSKARPKVSARSKARPKSSARAKAAKAKPTPSST